MIKKLSTKAKVIAAFLVGLILGMAAVVSMSGDNETPYLKLYCSDREYGDQPNVRQAARIIANSIKERSNGNSEQIQERWMRELAPLIERTASSQTQLDCLMIGSGFTVKSVSREQMREFNLAYGSDPFGTGLGSIEVRFLVEVKGTKVSVTSVLRASRML